MSQLAKNNEKVKVPLVKTTYYRWVVMALIFVVYTIANADRANLGIALPYIKKEFGINNTEAGAIISLLFFGYALAQIPSGFLYKRFSTRIVFPISMLLTSIFTGLMGTTSSPLMLKFFRFGLGLAEGPLPIGCLTTINHWFPNKEKGTATGMYLAASKCGPVIVPPICILIIQAYGWREIFIVFAIPGILLSILWYFMVHDKPSESKFCSPSEVQYIETDHQVITDQPKAPVKQYNLAWLDKLIRAKKINPVDTVSKVFRSWNVIGNALSYLFMVGIVNVIMAWIPTYLMTEKHFQNLKLGFLASAPFVGAVAGNLVGGWISDKVLNKRRKPLMMLSCVFTCIMMLALINTPNDAMTLGFLLFMAGFLLNLGYSAFSVYAMGVATKETYPLAYGIVNTGGQLGGALAPLAVGMILDAFQWNSVFMFLAICSAVSLLILATIDEPMNDIIDGRTD